MIKVSIIIPAYNVEGLIERTLSTTLSQTLEEIEVIVVNDGSTDQTGSKLEKYRYDPRVILIHKENGGVSSARNAGLKVARGKYFYFLDGDDWLEPSGLEVMYLASEAKGCDMLMTQCFIDDDEGNVEFKWINTPASQDHLKEFFLGNIYPGQPGKFIRGDLYRLNGIFYPEGLSLGEDLLVNVKLLLHAEKIVFMETAFLHYIQRNESITATYNENNLHIFEILNQAADYMKENNSAASYTKEMEFLEFLHIYYMRLINNKGMDLSIHKKIYQRCRERDYNFQNPHIQDFLKQKPLLLRISIYLLRRHYYLGLVLIQLLKLLNHTKKRLFRR